MGESSSIAEAAERTVNLETRPAPERAGLPPEAAARLLPLEGGRNFRDLGGYATRDGRQVRWGRVFRSGAMSALTARDQAHLDAVGVSVVCDLRSTAERLQEPNPWASPRIVAFDYEMHTTNLAAALGEAGGPDAVRAMMLASYERMPYHHLDNLRLLFQELAASERALAFNCTAGKDRTGIAAGLILSLLDVPRATVLADYSLSDKIVDFESIAAGAAYGVGFGALARVPTELRAPMLRSDPDYLDAALSSIERQDGSVDAYLRDHLGVSADQAAVLRERLLEA